MRPYSIFDQIATTLAFIGFSLPTFFTGILFILFFSVYLDWLPFIYRADISATGWRWCWEHARQAIMPVAVLGLFQGAALTRFVRSAVLDVIRLDYINTARAKGLAEQVTIVKHGVRNALIPVVTLMALQIPTIFTGAVITEQIFRVPGIGSLLISAILANDTPVIMAITFVFSCLVVTFSLVADMLYGWLDPRITLPLTMARALPSETPGLRRSAPSSAGRRPRCGGRPSSLPQAPAGLVGRRRAPDHGGGGGGRPLRLPRADRRDRLQGQAPGPLARPSARDRRPRARTCWPACCTGGGSRWPSASPPC